MSLVKRSSFWPDLNPLFDGNWMNQWPDVSWTPAVNVSENDKSFEIELAAPGIKKEEFKVDVKDGIVTISCTSKKEEEEKKKNYTRREFSSRSFSRSFTLPDNVDQKNVSAKYEEGVLRVTLKKSEKSTPAGRKVEIS
jgi:HSP20 family protein